MDAFLFTLIIFLYFWVVGFAFMSIFNPRLCECQSVLTAPVVGIAVTILPVFIINRQGVPIKDFGLILVLTLLLASVLVFIKKQPRDTVKKLRHFLGALVVALVLSAWPMFFYGFDWASFSNDDMANYSLGAQRFLNHGFFDLPNLGDLSEGKDYSLAYWFMHVPSKSRSGSELMLATAWAATGLNAHQIFMPLIMALYLALVASVGAMVAGYDNGKRIPLIAIGLMACSPLTTLGALYQLIGQVGGLALLSASVTLMYRQSTINNIGSILVYSVPASLIFASLFVWYPELLPFFGLGWILYILLAVKFKMASLWGILLPALIVGVLVLSGLNKYVITSLIFMLNQAAGGMQAADMTNVLFPYFLVPSGIAAFWGLVPIAGNIREPFISVTIVGGVLLFYWLGRYVVAKQIKSGGAAVSMLMVMLAMGLVLFYRNNDFGIFKLAMFAQPFLIGVVATEISAVGWFRNSRKKIVAFAAVVLLALNSQIDYVGKSTGEIFGGLNELPRASEKKANQQFERLIDGIRNENFDRLISDSSNVVLAKYQSFYTQGISLVFPSRNFFSNIAGFFINDKLAVEQTGLSYEKIYERGFAEYQAKGSGSINKFYFPNSGPSQLLGRTLITTNEPQTIFNLTTQNENSSYFKLVDSPRNHLIFVHSDLGNHYYFGDKNKISFFQLENDPMFPGQKISALGEHFLFHVLGPTRAVRVRMELSDTVAKQFSSELPRPQVQGSTVEFVGRGSGRVFSDLVAPEIINDTAFISINMARDGKHFPSSTKGLMLLYGREIPTDPRKITAFGRDISLVTEDQYQELSAPESLKNFPADLADKSLEYSGIYEDGWVSERSFFVLSPRGTSKFIIVSGSIPQIDDPKFSSVLKLIVNGTEIASQNLGLGTFELKVPMTSQAPRQRIELTFSKYQILPGADGRVAPAMINRIGFE